MRFKFAFQAAALAAALTALPASAIEQPPAFATIDWSTFQFETIDTNPADLITPSFVPLSQNAYTQANVVSFTSDSASDWETPLVSVDDVGSATVGDSLNAQFSAAPSTLNAFAQAQRYGSFVVSGNTLVTFSVAASVGINLPVPLNGNAYAWSRLEVRGPGFFGDTENEQVSVTDKLVFADGSGVPQYQSGVLYASFFNGTSEDMTVNVNAFAQVSSYGFIPVVPEPETYGMMLAGLGLLVAVARRRRHS